jgi:hypothetical protein
VLAGVAVLVVATLATVIGVAASGADPEADGPDAAAPTSASASAAGDGVAAEVRDWVAGELPTDAVLSVTDADLRTALTEYDRDRFPAPADAPDDALLITGEDAPEDARVLAVFDRPDAAPVAVVDPDPGRPTADETERRQRLAAAVLANPGTGAGGRADEVLRAGHVDARLLGLLAGLVAQLGVGVADLPPAPREPAHGPAEGPPVRRVLIDRLDGAPLEPGSAATDRLLTWVEAQRAPFAPDTVEQTDDGILLGFRYASAPDSVVSATTP